MKIWATFKGYSGSYRTGGRAVKFVDDEWLCELYSLECLAREAVLKFGEGKAFDSNRENQITRYYEPGKTVFDKGSETDFPMYGEMREWMRYTPLTVHEPEEKENYTL